ncbi:hypothetical protein [uncultured Sphingomonas sp.]|uniref:hypothetical protein n=1 Tax=uncultured Sphingomonas sp. TaxID=158754 RepID=UPI00258A0AED|nr:hypothetical protein [uncultured Sphingomonas sp.]
MERGGKRRGNLLASAAIGARQAGRVAAPAEPLVIEAVFAADASCTATIGSAAFVLPDAAPAFVAALGTLPDPGRPLTLAVRGGAAARHVGAIVRLIGSAGFDNVTVLRSDGTQP